MKIFTKIKETAKSNRKGFITVTTASVIALAVGITGIGYGVTGHYFWENTKDVNNAKVNKVATVEKTNSSKVDGKIDKHNSDSEENNVKNSDKKSNSVAKFTKSNSSKHSSKSNYSGNKNSKSSNNTGKSNNSTPSKPKNNGNTGTTKPSTPSKPQHSHSYNIPIYSTREVPVYSERECFYFPSTGRKFYSQSEALNYQDYLMDNNQPCNYTIYDEEYQSGTRTESYISGYKCSCGAVQ